MRIIDPTQARPELRPTTTGPDDVRLGGRVCLLSNSKPNASTLLEATALQLGLLESTLVSKATASMAAPDELLARISANFDSALVAIGD